MIIFLPLVNVLVGNYGWETLNLFHVLFKLVASWYALRYFIVGLVFVMANTGELLGCTLYSLRMYGTNNICLIFNINLIQKNILFLDCLLVIFLRWPPNAIIGIECVSSLIALILTRQSAWILMLFIWCSDILIDGIVLGINYWDVLVSSLNIIAH